MIDITDCHYHSFSFQIKKGTLLDTVTIRKTVVFTTTIPDSDTSGPSITLKNGAASGSRIKDAAGALTVSISDPSGIDSVTATINTTVVTGISSSGNDYTIPYSLITYGTNTIVINSTDNSTKHNSNSLIVTYIFNTVPTPISISSPLDGAQEIDTLPTFSWNGGKDSDGDKVFFKVLYGKDSTFYRYTINLTQFCTDPDANILTFSVISPSSAKISGSTLTCASDSQLITIRAIDNFTAQPCTSVTTFRRWFVNPALMKFIPSAGDTFTMGTNYAEDTDDERPEHRVQFTRNIFVDSTEVTQADYAALMGINPSIHTFYGGGNYPVENVTWYDAVLYCNERSKHYGLDTVYTYSSLSGIYGNGCTELGNIQIDHSKHGFRLPTEAEWGYFAKANKSTYSPIMEYSWCSDNSEGHTQPVAQKKANKCMLFDVLGNVEKYCNDWYQDHYDSTAAIHVDPIGPLSGTTKVTRGSSYIGDYTEEHKVTFRWNSKWNTSVFRGSGTGFRVVRTVP